MQILTGKITITGSDYDVYLPDSKGQELIKVGSGKLTPYQIEKQLYSSGETVAFKKGKSPYLLAPAAALGVAVGTVKSVNTRFTDSGAGIVEVSLDQDGGYARIKYSSKLPVTGGEVLEGSLVKFVGTASAYKPEDKDTSYISIWASSVEVIPVAEF
jgi:hypothetical protein